MKKSGLIVLILLVLFAPPVSAQTCHDLTGDGFVDIFDLVTVAVNLGTSNVITDIDGSGLVDFSDLTLIVRNFGCESQDLGDLPIGLIIYDGEPGGFEEGSLTENAETLPGIGQDSSYGLKLNPDKWVTPKLSFSGGASRANYSRFAAIEFYFRSDTADPLDLNFSFQKWPQIWSNILKISDYIEGGVIDNTYRKVLVPIIDLQTETWNLDGAENLYFSPDPLNRNSYVDNVVARQAVFECGDGIDNDGDGDIDLDDRECENEFDDSELIGVLFECNNGVDDDDDGKIDSLDPGCSGMFDDTEDDDAPLIYTGDVTSSSINISWGLVGGATGYNIFIASEPQSTAIESERYLVAAVDAQTTDYRLINLAANVDTFIRVESLPTNSVVLETHARTTGGPGAELDTPLKQIHLIAPDILMLVFRNEEVNSYSPQANRDDGEEVTNYTGFDLQAGTWGVTRISDIESPIGVNTVYRHSVPAGSMDYDLGYATDTMNNIIDVDHRIYLVLDQPIGNNEVLRITHSGRSDLVPPFLFPLNNRFDEVVTFGANSRPTDVDVLLPFSDKYLETPVIQLNQVGYNPKATERYAYVSYWMGDGGPLSLSNFPSDASVLKESSNPLLQRTAATSSIPITLRSAFDADSGTEVREINLASVGESDSDYYRVHIPGVGVSWRTMVSEYATLKAFYVTTRGLYLNRWGRDLQCQYTDWCPRPPDNISIYTADIPYAARWAPEDTPLVGQRSVQGGHHDAGDFDISWFHFKVALWLMSAYETNKSAFTDNQLNIPESGNGIPDFLDEALWNLAAWEQLQEADGGIRARIESWRHPWGYYYADEEPLNYFTWERNGHHTLRVAGMFAQAARLVQEYDQTKSDELKAESISAYNYAVANGFDFNTGGPMLYASGELYKLTNDTQYKDMFETTWVFLGEENLAKGWSTTLAFDYYIPSDPWQGFYDVHRQPVVSEFILAYMDSENVDQSYRNQTITKLTQFAQENIGAFGSFYAHRSGRTTNTLAWGTATVTGKQVMPVIARLQLDEQLTGSDKLTASEKQDLINTASLAIDYALGGNPIGLSWTTGLGSQSPQNPLHADSLAFQKEKGLPPIPGIPVYGPIQDTQVWSYYDPPEYINYPPFHTQPGSLKFGDTRLYVPATEFTVHETQAPQTRLLSLLVEPGLAVPDSWKPGNSNHQNTLPTFN